MTHPTAGQYQPLSKMFEKVMHTGLLKHLTDHIISSNKQHGFRTKLETDNATYQ